MASPLILPVGYVYIGRHGVVSTYPQGDGLDLAVTTSKALRDPTHLKQLQAKLAETNALMTDEQLSAEAHRYVESVTHGFEQIETVALIRRLNAILKETSPEAHLNFNQVNWETKEELHAYLVTAMQAFIPDFTSERLMREEEAVRSPEFQETLRNYAQLQTERYLGLINLGQKAKEPYRALLEHIARNPQEAETELAKTLKESRDKLIADPKAVIEGITDAYVRKHHNVSRSDYEKEVDRRVRYMSQVFDRIPKTSNAAAKTGIVCISCPGNDIRPYVLGSRAFADQLAGLTGVSSLKEPVIPSEECFGMATGMEPLAYIARPSNPDHLKRAGTESTALEELTHALQCHYPWSDDMKRRIENFLPQLRQLANTPSIDKRFDETQLQQLSVLGKTSPPSPPKSKGPEEKQNPLETFINGTVHAAGQLFSRYAENYLVRAEGIAMLFKKLHEARKDNPGIANEAESRFRPIRPLMEFARHWEEELDRLPAGHQPADPHKLHQIVPIGVSLGTAMRVA